VPLRVVAFKIPKDLLELLDLYALNHGLYRSEAIRLAIQKLLESEKDEEIATAARTVLEA